MYAFLDRLINLALPRIRDFQGMNPKSFDGHGNYSLGLDEQLMFPKLIMIKLTKFVEWIFLVVTTARNDQEAMLYLNLRNAFKS